MITINSACTLIYWLWLYISTLHTHITSTCSIGALHFIHLTRYPRYLLFYFEKKLTWRFKDISIYRMSIFKSEIRGSWVVIFYDNITSRKIKYNINTYTTMSLSHNISNPIFPFIYTRIYNEYIGLLFSMA